MGDELDLDLASDELMTLTEAGAMVPGSGGRDRVCGPTVLRWAVAGYRGVLLKTVIVAGRRLTTRRWVEEFILACTREVGPKPAVGAAARHLGRRAAMEAAAAEAILGPCDGPPAGRGKGGRKPPKAGGA